MKTSILYAYVALMGMASAQEPCVEGKRVTISPNYIVEYKCNKYRLGQLHNNIPSHEDCAAMCEATGLDVCTYHAGQRKCIVGDPNGREGTRAGATYMVRVPEDPFQETCEEERDELRRKLDDLKSQLDTCRANPGPPAPTPSPATCGINRFAPGQYSTFASPDLASCKNACNADPRCLSYSTTGVTNNVAHCSLYDKESSDLQFQLVPNYPRWAHYDKRCG